VSEPSLDLDPAIVEWAAHIAEIATMLPGLTSSDMQARRAAERVLSDKLAREYTEEQVPGVLIHAVTIATAIGRLRIRRYRPVDLPDLAPTELFLHGGGFISGSVDELINDRLLTRRAHDARLQVISVDYRLAPEHPYPAAVDDVIAVLDVVREQPERFGVDVLRIGIGGVSAGAGIAASAALHLRDRGDDVLIHQSLEVPAVALRAFGLSAVKYARGYGLDGYQDLAALYLGEAGRQASTAQPLFAPELSGLPSAFIQVAEHDPLRDGGIAYGARLREARVSSVVHIGRGHVHGSPGLTATLPAARAWQARSAAAARLAFHPHHQPV
jgi:acetyl esterase